MNTNEKMNKMVVPCDVAIRRFYRMYVTVDRNANTKEIEDAVYHRAEDESNENLTQWQREKFHLWMNDEYFMVWDDAPDWDAPGPDLLYVVNVSADSLLTAAAELFELLHRKF